MRFGKQKTGANAFAVQLLNRAIVVAVISNSVDFILASGGLSALLGFAGVPVHFLEQIIYPEVFLFSLTSLALYPIMLINLGQLAGASPAQMIPCITLNVLGSCCMVASATSLLPWHPLGALLCTGGSIVCLGSSALLMSNLPAGAHQICYANRYCVERASDAILYFWSLPALVQAFTLLDQLSIDQARVWLAIADVACKCGVLYFMMQSQRAMNAAGDHFAEDSITGMHREPQRQPDFG